jgi:hypothetical protein
VTLVCCYAACWGPTKTTGVEDVDSVTGLAIMPSPKMPFVVAVDSWGGTRSYYFWCFGYVAKLPWEREVESGDTAEARQSLTRRSVRLSDLEFTVDDNLTELDELPPSSSPPPSR